MGSACTQGNGGEEGQGPHSARLGQPTLCPCTFCSGADSTPRGTQSLGRAWTWVCLLNAQLVPWAAFDASCPACLLTGHPGLFQQLGHLGR